MALHYQAEYRIGRRGGRVCHSYSGFRAFLAILSDLVFGLFFDALAALFALVTRTLVLGVQFTIELLKLCWKTLVYLMTALVHSLEIPDRVTQADVAAAFRAMVPVRVLAFPFHIMQHLIARSRWCRQPDPIATPRGPAEKADWGFAREV